MSELNLSQSLIWAVNEGHMITMDEDRYEISNPIQCKEENKK